MLDAFLSGALAGYGIAIPVGAIAVLIVSVGMRCGFTCGASAGAGAATADLAYASVAAFAGSAAARAVAPWADQFRLASVLVLLALAARGLMTARHPIAGAEGGVPMRRGELARTYTRFLGLTIINPMTVVYFGTMVLGTGVGTEPNPFHAAVFAGGAFLASLSWQTLLAGIGALARHGLSSRFRTATAVVGNLIIVALAVRILL